MNKSNVYVTLYSLPYIHHYHSSKSHEVLINTESSLMQEFRWPMKETVTAWLQNSKTEWTSVNYTGEAAYINQSVSATVLDFGIKEQTTSFQNLMHISRPWPAWLHVLSNVLCCTDAMNASDTLCRLEFHPELTCGKR